MIRFQPAEGLARLTRAAGEVAETVGLARALRWARTPRGWSWLALIVPALGIVALFSFEPEAVFGIDVETEVLELRVESQPMPRWYLEDIGVRGVGPGERRFSGSLQVSGGDTRIRFERAGNGELRISVRAEAGPAVVFYDRGELPSRELVASSSVGLRISPGQVRALAFVGDATVGDESFEQNRAALPLLLQGRVVVVGRAWFTGERYEAGSVELTLGDRLRVVRAGEEERAEGFGFVRLSPDPVASGLQVVYYARGHGVDVERYGSGRHRIRLSLWHQLAGDPAVQALAVLLLAFYTPLLDGWWAARHRA